MTSKTVELLPNHDKLEVYVMYDASSYRINSVTIHEKNTNNVLAQFQMNPRRMFNERVCDERYHTLMPEYVRYAIGELFWAVNFNINNAAQQPPCVVFQEILERAKATYEIKYIKQKHTERHGDHVFMMMYRKLAEHNMYAIQYNYDNLELILSTENPEEGGQVFAIVKDNEVFKRDIGLINVDDIILADLVIVALAERKFSYLAFEDNNFQTLL